MGHSIFKERSQTLYDLRKILCLRYDWRKLHEAEKNLNEYNQFKREMEISAQKYGLTNQKTVEFSQKLDLVVNEFMMIKYSEVDKQERLG
ncbi:aspartyl-phosphate phosphatase Spo0E family protein [Bacillus paramycoides]|uniref:aspartyl-phosphate phosphatase Spo0E family protein n=1 Tax=Bacillus TaxID=1386 RepID=UPI0006536E05|nr:aspartyl-phosphate phosphatase Spo0E family protein [Bacillus sp. LK2]KMN44598.1 hypothetical protein VK90_13165 [Bacillus sp. LK2]